MFLYFVIVYNTTSIVQKWLRLYPLLLLHIQFTRKKPKKQIRKRLRKPIALSLSLSRHRSLNLTSPWPRRQYKQFYPRRLSEFKRIPQQLYICYINFLTLRRCRCNPVFWQKPLNRGKGAIVMYFVSETLYPVGVFNATYCARPSTAIFTSIFYLTDSGGKYK